MTYNNTHHKSIFIADHTGQFCTLHVNYLNSCGFDVVTANNKASAFRKFRIAQPGIVLIHEKFPNIDLHRIIKLIRTYNRNVPVILIVSNPEVANVVTAFHLSVNDCITIDVNSSILVQRIHRSLTTLAPATLKIPLGRSLFLPNYFQILCDTEERIELSPKETELLLLLCNKRGEICTSKELTHALWGQKDPDKKLPPSHWQMNLGSLIYSLKTKMKNLYYIYIENISRIGYRLHLSKHAYKS